MLPTGTSPSVDGFSSPKTIFAVVVLPHPDSPTSPIVLPAGTSNETSSTAFNQSKLPIIGSPLLT